MKIKNLFFLAIIAALLGMVIACDELNVLDTPSNQPNPDLPNPNVPDTLPSYTVNFNTNGGSPAPQNQTIKQGGKVTEPAAMNKSGYGFAGWYKEATLINVWNFTTDTITGNITLYAKWDSNYHTVSFTANGGTPVPPQQNIAHGYKAIKPQNMSKAGYKFEGWYTEASFNNVWDFNSDTVITNIALYAKWGYILPPTTVQVEGTTLAEKLQWIASNAASNTNYFLEVNDDEFLNSQTLSYSEKSNIIIQLTGIGNIKTIELYGSGSLFTIGDGVTLVLNENIVLNGSVNAAAGNLIMNNGSKIIGGVSVSITREYEYVNNNIVYVWYSGTFTMNGGEISGGGVSISITRGYEYWYSGTFTMNGGEISGGGVTTNNDIDTGIYARETFTMNGGKISGNTASYYGYGGGVYISNGTFTMTGGEISGNTASYGGGVYVSNGTFTMTGGEISGNTASYGGGGVCISGGTFTMTGGEISGNTVSFFSSSSYSYGGGVYVSGSRFEKTGGIITGYSSDTGNGNVVEYNGNVQNNRGHAVYVAHNDSRFVRRKETTSGQGDNLIYILNEPAPPTISGAWDE